MWGGGGVRAATMYVRCDMGGGKFPEVGQSSGEENLISIITVNEKAFSLDYYLN